MATLSRRRIILAFSGDVSGEETYDAGNNASSPCFIQVYKLLAGAASTFTVPNAANGFGAFVPKAVTIIKPGDYAGTIILKGVSTAADNEGVYLHPTDPDSFSIDQANQSVIVLKASADCTVRLIWS